MVEMAGVTFFLAGGRLVAFRHQQVFHPGGQSVDELLFPGEGAVDALAAQACWAQFASPLPSPRFFPGSQEGSVAEPVAAVPLQALFQALSPPGPGHIKVEPIHQEKEKEIW
jgi:hypothetical protein